MYRAIIQSIDSNYQVTVRIPFYDYAEDSLGSTTNSKLYKASICTMPGCKPAYVVGDIVYVDFENNDLSKPVVLGVLYREGSLSSLDISCQSMTSEISTTLSSDTTIGNITKDEIKSLSRVSDNIQYQIATLQEMLKQLMDSEE